MFATRRHVLALGAASLASACATTQAEAPDALLAEALATGTTPGMAALTIRDFRVEAMRLAGVRKLGSPEPVARDDRWHLGSDGKAMTATMIARLVEQGALSWEKPLAEMLPDLAATMQPAYRHVTLPDLLSHRAGLPENTADLAFFATFYDDLSPLPAQRLRYVEACLRDAPVGPSRAERSYSNTGYLIAGACAERATGRAFEDLIVAEVFAPLGVRSVSFDQFGGAGEPCGHIDGRVADRAQDANPRMFAPAGGMRMSLFDWARFCIDHMDGERGRGSLLSAEAYRFLHTGQGGTISALGWGAAPHPMGRKGPALTHSGSDGNWHALVCLFPQSGNGAVVACNASDSMGGDKASVEVLRVLVSDLAEPWQETVQ